MKCSPPSQPDSSSRETKCEIRVRYAETDKMGVVYHANYLAWFEVGRTDLLRQLGANYREIENDGFALPVLEVNCKYIKPARYDDIVEIRTTVSRPSRLLLRFDYELIRPEDGVRLATGNTVHVTVNTEGRPCRLPQRLQELAK